MLVMLGFNDLGWFYNDDNDLVASITNLITNAQRSSKWRILCGDFQG